MKKIKIALIGIGHLGTRHLKTLDDLKSKAEIIAVCDLHKDRTARLAEHYGVPFIADYKQLSGQIDAVDICVPTETHHEVASFFLNKGVHAFIEKPFTQTLEQADELIDLARRNHLKIQVGHIEQFNSGFQSIKRFTRDPLFIECHRMSPYPNRSLDIGVVMDLMIHDIDIILGLVHSPIEDIQATGINVLSKHEDIASVRITFENGCVCNLTASRISDKPMRKIRLFQKNCYISLDYVGQEACVYKKYLSLILKHNLPIEKEEPLKKELEHFLDCVRTGETPLISGVEAKNALKVALDIGEKIRQAQAKALAHLSQ